MVEDQLLAVIKPITAPGISVDNFGDKLGQLSVFIVCTSRTEGQLVAVAQLII